ITLAGGSAFGLEAASGVRRYLEHKSVGYQTSAARVPLVAAAILYDLAIGKPGVRPTREMGEAAAANASTGAVKEGAVGAGAGVARTIAPVWTMYDGDLVFALSAGTVQADMTALGVAAARAVSEAILRAVRLAPSLGGLPGLGSG